MPTGRQIRAARMLIDWEATDLSRSANLSTETILKIERGEANPKPDTTEKIINALRDGGVEFDGERGVKLILEDYRVFGGEDCYLRLLDEVFLDLHARKGAEVLFICVDDAVSSPEIIDANKRIRNAGIKCRYLCSETATKFDYTLEDYRAISKEYFKNSVMVVYDEKVATLRGTNNGVLIVRDKDQAEMLRGLFNIVWSHSKSPKNGVKSK